MENNRLTKSQLVDDVAAKTGLTKVAVEKTITELQNSIIEAVAAGKSVALTNFVSFSPKIRSSREDWVNPKTQEIAEVKEKRIVKIAVLKQFEDKVANSTAE